MIIHWIETSFESCCSCCKYWKSQLTVNILFLIFESQMSAVFANFCGIWWKRIISPRAHSSSEYIQSKESLQEHFQLTIFWSNNKNQLNDAIRYRRPDCRHFSIRVIRPEQTNSPLISLKLFQIICKYNPKNTE